MIFSVMLVAVGGLSGALSLRVAARWSVPAGTPVRAACAACGASFAEGWRGWVAFTSCPGRCRPAARDTALAVAAGMALGALLGWRMRPEAAPEALLAAAWFVLLAAGLILVRIDLAVRRLPTPIVWTATAGCLLLVAAAATTAGSVRLLLAAIAGGAIYGGVYLLMAWASAKARRARIGLGDVRLAVLLGTGLGAISGTALFLGALLPYILAVPAWVFLLRRGEGRHSLFAFGPFMFAGAAIAALT